MTNVISLEEEALQTFLPYPDFEKSFQVLDRQRLGKQRVEAKQIVMTLSGQSSGWTNHPAVRMWRGYEGYLCLYGVLVCGEWINRGYEDNLRSWFLQALEGRPSIPPAWFGDESFHASHRSNLLRKDPAWYKKYGWTESPDLPYVWPVAAEAPKKRRWL